MKREMGASVVMMTSIFLVIDILSLIHPTTTSIMSYLSNTNMNLDSSCPLCLRQNLALEVIVMGLQKNLALELVVA
jgi:hypothetical protein